MGFSNRIFRKTVAISLSASLIGTSVPGVEAVALPLASRCVAGSPIFQTTALIQRSMVVDPSASDSHLIAARAGVMRTLSAGGKESASQPVDLLGVVIVTFAKQLQEARTADQIEKVFKAEKELLEILNVDTKRLSELRAAVIRVAYELETTPPAASETQIYAQQQTMMQTVLNDVNKAAQQEEIPLVPPAYRDEMLEGLSKFWAIFRIISYARPLKRTTSAKEPSSTPDRTSSVRLNDLSGMVILAVAVPELSFWIWAGLIAGVMILLGYIVDRVSQWEPLESRPPPRALHRQPWIDFFSGPYQAYLDASVRRNEPAFLEASEHLLAAAKQLNGRLHDVLTEYLSEMEKIGHGEKADISQIQMDLEGLLEPVGFHAEWTPFLNSQNVFGENLVIYEIVSQTDFTLRSSELPTYSRPIRFLDPFSQVTVRHQLLGVQDDLHTINVFLDTTDQEAKRWANFLFNPSVPLPGSARRIPGILDKWVRQALLEELESVLNPGVLKTAMTDPAMRLRVQKFMAIFLAQGTAGHEFWHAYEDFRAQTYPRTREVDQEFTAPLAAIGYVSVLPKWEMVMWLLRTLSPNDSSVHDQAAMRDIRIRSALLGKNVDPHVSRMSDEALMQVFLALLPDDNVQSTSQMMLNDPSIPAHLRVPSGSIRIESNGIEMESILNSRAVSQKPLSEVTSEPVRSVPLTFAQRHLEELETEVAQAWVKVGAVYKPEESSAVWIRFGSEEWIGDQSKRGVSFRLGEGPLGFEFFWDGEILKTVDPATQKSVYIALDSLDFDWDPRGQKLQLGVPLPFRNQWDALEDLPVRGTLSPTSSAQWLWVTSDQAIVWRGHQVDVGLNDESDYHAAMADIVRGPTQAKKEDGVMIVTYAHPFPRIILGNVAENVLYVPVRLDGSDYYTSQEMSSAKTQLRVWREEAMTYSNRLISDWSALRNAERQTVLRTLRLAPRKTLNRMARSVMERAPLIPPSRDTGGLSLTPPALRGSL